MNPLICERTEEELMHAYVNIVAPPIECPRRKSGTGQGRWDKSTECRSAITRDVGPVRPLLFWSVTERPQPLSKELDHISDWIRRAASRIRTNLWSKLNTSMPREARERKKVVMHVTYASLGQNLEDQKMRIYCDGYSRGEISLSPFSSHLAVIPRYWQSIHWLVWFTE
jgi:hypothetical protein